MNRVQASALLVVSLLFTSCGGNGTKSDDEKTWTKQQVIAAAKLRPAPGGYLHRQSGCKVSAILTSRDQVQDRAGAAEPVAANPDGSGGVVVDAKPGARLASCLLVMKRELLALGADPAGASAS